MSLTVLPGDNLAENFGTTLAAEMRESIYAGGDCRYCGKSLDTGKAVRLESGQMFSMSMVWARHASCPFTIEDNQAHVLTPHTWGSFTTMMTTVEPGPKRFLRKSEPIRRDIPLVILNPSLDGMLIKANKDGSTPQTLREMYVDKGFELPGHANLTDKPEHNFVGSLDADGVSFHVIPFGADYSAALAPAMRESIASQGGFMLAITHALSCRELPTKTQLGAFLEGGNYALAWIPVTPPGESPSATPWAS